MTTPINPDSTNNTGRNLLIGCGCLVLLTLCICAIASILAPQIFLGYLANGVDKEIDPSLTQIVNKEELVQNKASYDQKIDKIENEGIESKPTLSLTLKDTEILGVMFSDLETSELANNVAIGINSERIKVQFDAKEMLKELQKENQTQQNYDWMNGILISVELGVNSTNDGLVITDVSLGNAFIDAFIPNNFDSELTKDLNESLNNIPNNPNYNLSSIKLGDNEITLNYSKVR